MKASFDPEQHEAAVAARLRDLGLPWNIGIKQIVQDEGEIVGLGSDDRLYVWDTRSNPGKWRTA